MKIKILKPKWNKLGFTRKAEEDWYNIETSLETEDAGILAKILRRGKDDFVSDYAAGNSNCPSEVLAEVLRRGKDDHVSRTAASNSNCSPEALAEVLRRGKNDWVSYHAAKNLNCSPEALAEVLARGRQCSVSRQAARNPNTPPEARIDWLEATGQLTKYDPEKFELEHDEEDKDLEELRKLMGKRNFNLHRKAQEEDWYNVVMAIDTEDDEILAKILRKGKGDYVSQYAALNPNCHPEALAEVLKRGNDDCVSKCVAQNLNCPPEVLAEVLKRGNNDWVSYRAAENPNCPPEALAEVLRRGNDDGVSRHAARNPNCPPKARLDWYEATGQLIKYDPEKFELEHDEEDKDLEELRKLMGNNRNSIKTSKKVNNEYSWVFINLPDEAKKAVLSFGKEIDKDDLYIKEADDGLETDPHVTVKYALLTNDFKDVKEVIGKHKKGNLFLGKSSVFECEDYDVVKMTVESDVLRDLHEKLNGLPHKDKHFEYNPHATIAYVKKGKGTKYDGKFEINKKFKFDNVRWQICHNEGVGKKIKLAFNLHRKAQKEDWYNVETAYETKDPEILTKILRKGNNDRVSLDAAQNPNCPPEVLAEVLKRGEDDCVSMYAAQNPNCPPEALVKFLRRGKNDSSSPFAARNPNCPPEALAEVLARGNFDSVSWEAVKNPNCPPKARLDWLEAMGQLTKYDPETFELEKVPEDKDLEELRKLMGKRNFNLHKKNTIPKENMEM